MNKYERKRIVYKAFQDANVCETLASQTVLSVGCDTKSDAMLGLDPDMKIKPDELHKRKIDIANEILALNVGGHMGASTASEIAYAREHGKRVHWLEEVAV